MQKIQDRETDTHDGQIVIGNLHGHLIFLRRTGNKETQYILTAKKHDHSNYNCRNGSDHNCRPHPLPDPSDLTGPQILSNIGDHGIAIGSRRDLQQAVELVCRRKPGNKYNPKAIDNRLYDHTSHRNDPILKRHRRTKKKKLPCHTLMQPKIRPREGKHLNLPNMVNTEKCRNKLCDQRRGCRSCNAHMKAENKQDIQQNIGKRSHNHGI